MQRTISNRINKILKTAFPIHLSSILMVSASYLLICWSEILQIELCRRILSAVLNSRFQALYGLIILLLSFQILRSLFVRLNKWTIAMAEGSIRAQVMSYLIRKNGRLNSWQKCEMNASQRFTTIYGDSGRYISSLLEKSNLFSDFVIVPSYIIYGCTISIPITMSITFVSIILSLLNKRNKEKIYDNNREYNEAYGKWSDFMWKSLDNLQVIKVFLNKNKIREENKLRNKQLNVIQQKSLVAYLDVCKMEESSGIIFNLAIICFGFYGIAIKLIQASDLLAMIQSLERVQKSVFAIPEKFMQLNELESISSRIKEFIDLPEETYIDKQLDYFYGLEVKNMSFSYEEHMVIDSINLSLAKGKFYVIVGPSGSGKSTFLRALAKLIPVNGTIEWNGINIELVSRETLYSKMTYVSQNTIFLEDTIRNNISIHGDFHLSKYQRAIRKAHLEEFFINEKIKDSANLSFKGAPLSSGECQLVTLANVFYEEKELILLDEVFSAIDPAKEQSLFTELSSISRRGKTVILISHGLENLALADEILFMDQGRICEQGNLQMLLEQRNKFFQWLQMMKYVE